MNEQKSKNNTSTRGSSNIADRHTDGNNYGDNDSFRSRSLSDYEQEEHSSNAATQRRSASNAATESRSASNAATQSKSASNAATQSRSASNAATQSRRGTAEYINAISPDSYGSYKSNRRSPDPTNMSGKFPKETDGNKSRDRDGNEEEIYVETRLSMRSETTRNNATMKSSGSTPLKLESPTKLGDGGWQEGKTLAECNRHMLSRGIACDVTFLVGEGLQQFKAHKYILVSRSSAIYRLLEERLHETHTMISVPDVKADVFEVLLTYLYTGEIEWSHHVATALLHPAAKFGFKTLQRECFDYLVSEINSDNVCTLLENAHKYNVHTIYEKCLHFAHINGVDVLNAAAFRHLCKECVDAIARSDDLNADELLVYSGLMLWADEECRRRKLPPNEINRRDVLGSTLYSVRFSLIDVGVFASTISQNDVLSPDEKIILFQHYHGEISKLPAKFNRSPRRHYVVNESLINRAASHSNSIEVFKPYTIPRLQLTAPPISNRSYDDVIPVPDHFVTQRNKNQLILRVVRFRGIGEIWQLNGPDAISFRCSVDLRLRGVQIFGPSKSTDYYNVTLSVYDELKHEVRNEQINVVTDRSKVFDVVLKNSGVHVPSGRMYTVRTLMKGKPTIRGTDGVTVISTEGVEFEFTNSNMSSNGTDVSSGQIPALLFSKA